ncbi:MAG TPA: hypothetical protein HPP56_06125 [Nitrospirae bacterium]|nr:hypothetical protein [Nitrospirota bacterium]
MSHSVLILSPDKIRGALLTKVFEKNSFHVNLCRNLFDSYEVLKDLKPSLFLIDREGFYPNELATLTSLKTILKETSVLVVSNQPDYGLVTIRGVAIDWCVCNPLDLNMIAEKALELVNKKTEDTLKSLLPTDEAEDNKDKIDETTDEGKLQDDLMGYLRLK